MALRAPLICVGTFRIAKRKSHQSDNGIRGHIFVVFWTSAKAEMGHEEIKWQEK